MKCFDSLNETQKSFVEIEDVIIKEWQKVYLTSKMAINEFKGFPNKVFITETIFNV